MSRVRSFLDVQLHKQASPFLFVGSGISRRYLQIEDWDGLLRRFASFTTHPYEYFRSSANGDLPGLASQLAEEFHELWWKSPDYEESRFRSKSEATGRQSALKIEIANYVNSTSGSLPKSGLLAKELALLSKAVVDGVITTNYDPLLEGLFPGFRVFVGQDEMLFTDLQAVAEIYKIHGSSTSPNSLVLTSEDYARFNERNAYLAAKLLTIFVEHPIVFLGYSMNDRNVQSVIGSIAKCLTQNNIDRLRDRLIFVQWKSAGEPMVGPQTLIIGDFILNVIKIEVTDFVEVFESLAGLSRAFPARLLRQLKEHIYTLVLNNDPESHIAVVDLDDVDSNTMDVVFGVGIKDHLGSTGYVGLSRWDLIDDVVQDGRRLRADDVVSQALPQILRHMGNVPTFKYLRSAGKLTKAGAFRKNAGLDKKIVKMADQHRGGARVDPHVAKQAVTQIAGVTDLADLEAKLGVDGVYKFCLCLPHDCMSPDELRAFLRRNRNMQGRPSNEVQYAKLVCYLDWLENGR